MKGLPKGPIYPTQYEGDPGRSPTVAEPLEGQAATGSAFMPSGQLASAGIGGMANIINAFMQSQAIQQQIQQQRELEAQRVSTGAKINAADALGAGQISPLKELIGNLRASIK